MLGGWEYLVERKKEGSDIFRGVGGGGYSGLLFMSQVGTKQGQGYFQLGGWSLETYGQYVVHGGGLWAGQLRPFPF